MLTHFLWAKEFKGIKMIFVVIKRLACLIIFSLLAFQVNAEGLSEYLQNTETTEIAANTLSSDPTTTAATATTTVSAATVQDSAQLKNIIELVVAGIVAAALIIVLLMTFLGRWLAAKEKRIIKKLRIEAEKNSDHITSAATTIREQEKETTKITNNIRTQADEISKHQAQNDKYSKDIVLSAEKAKEHEKQLDEVSSKVSDDMTKIQQFWGSQVNETVDIISSFQHNLSENIDLASEGLEKINQKKAVSEELLQDVLNKHSEQKTYITNNEAISKKVSDNLEQAHKESQNLLSLLKKQQEQASLSLNEYSERLNSFEEQAYEQFDTSFQVADLARQELSANLDENRKHIESMRRQEEQSHSVNNQISKNLEALDYSKIVKISETLDTTQDMFDEIHHKVEETRTMLEELKQIEEDIKQTASNVENVAKSHSILDEQIDEVNKKADDIMGSAEKAVDSHNKEALKDLAEGAAEALENPSKEIRDNTTVAISEYKMASGDSSTPLSFFRDIQKSNNNKK